LRTICVEGNSVSGGGSASVQINPKCKGQKKANAKKQKQESIGRVDGIFPADVIIQLQEAMDMKKSEGCVFKGKYVYENGKNLWNVREYRLTTLYCQ